MNPAEATKVVREGLEAVRSEKIHTYNVSPLYRQHCG
jgi:hypothetical protein